MALLREVFGPGVEKVKLEHRGFKTPTGRAVEVTTIASHFVRILKGGSGEFVPRLTRSPFQHVEINPGDAGIYDRYVVQEISMSLIGKRFCHSLDYAPPPLPSSVKELAQYSPSAAASAASTASGHARGWKVLLLSEVDRLSKEAQAALRRTMEKYSATCRLILVCSSPSKARGRGLHQHDRGIAPSCLPHLPFQVIEPVRSRCLGIRVPAASQQDVMAVLATVAKKEGMALPPQLCAKIASQSNRNLRRYAGVGARVSVSLTTRLLPHGSALLLLEAAKVSAPGGVVSPQQPVPSMDWERYIGVLAQDILKEQRHVAGGCAL